MPIVTHQKQRRGFTEFVKRVCSTNEMSYIWEYVWQIYANDQENEEIINQEAHKYLDNNENIGYSLYIK